ncbi:MAG: thioredoxin-disulfide reductase [Patescibacteria group bacterium]|nr:thioredoxin-disulfide reductase [Patescibacteria group bacterium]
MENVIIIGGGPAGLSAGVYLARAGLLPLIFAGSPPGGQLMLTSEVENFPGYDSILGSQLIEKLRNQVTKFGAKIIDQNINKVNLSASKKEVESGGKTYTTRSLIIAVGASALWLNVSGEQRLRGKGVSACAVCDGFFFRDKIVAVVGGGDSAMEEALTLTKFAKKVYIIHRRDSFRASKIMQGRVLNNPKIKVIWNSVVDEILGEEKVEGVKIRINSQLQTLNPKQYQNSNNQDSKRFENSGFGNSDLFRASSFEFRILKVDGVFVAIGHKPDTDIFENQIELDEKGYIITSERLAWELARLKIKNKKLKMTVKNEKWERMINKFNFDYKTQTSVVGVFAAGDCVDFEFRQAGTAAGMGIEAALEAEKWLRSVEN